MGRSAGEQLLRRVREVVRAAGLVKEFEAAQRFTLCVENDPYMQLVIESWPAPDRLQGERRRILVGHYYTQNGCKYPDPELEMTEYGFPVRLRQTVFEIMETPVLWRDLRTGEILVNTYGKRAMAELLRIWARNIKHQGFVDAAARIISADPDPRASVHMFSSSLTLPESHEISNEKPRSDEA